MFQRLFRTRPAQSLVETAILLPLMMTLTFGVIDTGFAFYAYVQVINASREGAQSGSQYRYLYASPGSGTAYTVTQNDQNRGFGGGVSTEDIYENNARTVVQQSVGNLEPALAQVEVSYPDVLDSTKPNRRGQAVRVQVTYVYSLPISSSFGFVQPTVTLRSTTEATIRNQ
ncbi:MAG: pilus assembly protein [Chloroflexia bacterium]|nr:pilus assembly protein [Chloroflexia bacterium]